MKLSRSTAAVMLSAVVLSACSSPEAPEPPASQPQLRSTLPSGLPSAAPSAPPSASASPGTPSPQPPASPSPTLAAPSTRPVAQLSWKACERGFECAQLNVQPVGGSGVEQLAVTRKRATGRRVGSLVVNPGGPGASAVEYLQDSYRGMSPEVRRHFDVVAFDPRGVGRSRPVDCASTETLDQYYHLDPSPDTEAELAALDKASRALARGCGERSGAVLDEVSTAQVAKDLEALRLALGGERLNYLGYSYGTSIGAAYLDRYAGNVRTMVLDGAVDPRLSWDQILEGQALGFEQALQSFLRWCAGSQKCALRGGKGPAARYDALEARIEAGALPAGGRSVGPGELSYGVGYGMYAPSLWPQLSQVLVSGEQGDGRGILAFSDAYLRRDRQGYAPLLESNLAVNCVDRPWPAERSAHEALAARVSKRAPHFGEAIALSGLTCAGWPLPASGKPHAVSGAGSPPVVVIGTTRDPATPYQWSVGLAEQLEEGVLLSYEGDGHTVYSGSAPRCIREPVDRYLLTGKAPKTLTC